MLGGKVTADVVFLENRNSFMANKTQPLTSVKKYLVVYSLLNTRHSLSTFLFFGPLIVADVFSAVEE